jgi:hypothetical protein
VTAEERLSPTRRLLIGFFTVAMGAVGFVAGRLLLLPSGNVRQPVEFNHLIHSQDVGLECVDCHKYFGTRQHSGLPTLQDCLECHEGGMTESSEEQKLLALAERFPGTSFRKLFTMPDHVYYSHREHVTVAGLECETCHGDIAATTAPPPTALVRITMDTCVDCHAGEGVQTDCTHCHR